MPSPTSSGEHGFPAIRRGDLRDPLGIELPIRSTSSVDSADIDLPRRRRLGSRRTGATGPQVQGVVDALSLANGAIQRTVDLPATPLPIGWSPLCSDYGNAAPAHGHDNQPGLRGQRRRPARARRADRHPEVALPTANVSSSPAIGGDGTVFFGRTDGAFYALELDGTTGQGAVAAAPVSSSPAIADDGVVFFVSDDGVLWAVR